MNDFQNEKAKITTTKVKGKTFSQGNATYAVQQVSQYLSNLSQRAGEIQKSSDRSFSDTSYQTALSKADFAKQIKAQDDALAEAEKEKNAQAQQQKEWAEHHPVESFLRSIYKSVDTQYDNLDKGLAQISKGNSLLKFATYPLRFDVGFFKAMSDFGPNLVLGLVQYGEINNETQDAWVRIAKHQAVPSWEAQDILGTAQTVETLGKGLVGYSLENSVGGQAILQANPSLSNNSFVRDSLTTYNQMANSFGHYVMSLPSHPEEMGSASFTVLSTVGAFFIPGAGEAAGAAKAAEGTSEALEAATDVTKGAELVEGASTLVDGAEVATEANDVIGAMADLSKVDDALSGLEDAGGTAKAAETATEAVGNAGKTLEGVEAGAVDAGKIGDTVTEGVGEAGKGLDAGETAGEVAGDAPKPVDEAPDIKTAPPQPHITSEELNNLQDMVLNDASEEEFANNSAFQTLKNTPTSELTQAEKAVMIDIRNSVPAPTDTTPMTKVVPQSDIEKYMSGEYTTIRGFTAKSSDLEGAGNPADYINKLRLDYIDGNGHMPFVADQPIGIIRYTSPDASDLEVPFDHNMGGTTEGMPPYTGNGYPSSLDGSTLPEYITGDRGRIGLDIDDGSRFYIQNPDGTEELVGGFKNGRFVRYAG